MAKGEDKSWVFDSLLEFLTGPIWNIPVLTFIEERSVVFDPESDADEEFQKIFAEYKYLVDRMLGSYMQDLDISAEDFHEACTEVTTTSEIIPAIKQVLYEQIWAAENYDIFKRMMIEKNIDLQLQALEILQAKYGILLRRDEEVPSLPGTGAGAGSDEANVIEAVTKMAISSSEKDEVGKMLAASEAERQRLIRLKPVRAPLVGGTPPPPPSSSSFAPLAEEGDEVVRAEEGRVKRGNIPTSAPA
ncbi:unnamed protein product, partial [Darwinula stevensoni]